MLFRSGYAVMLADKEILDGLAAANMLDWGSEKTHRVVKSTLAAEAAAMSFGFDRAIYARAVLAEILNGRLAEWRQMDDSMPLALQLRRADGHLHGSEFTLGMATDCKSLFDLCNRPTSSPTEKRIILDLLDVREQIDKEPGTTVRWVPTKAMLVDALTKHMADLTTMNSFFRTNVYSLREDPVLERQREEARVSRKKKAQ